MFELDLRKKHESSADNYNVELYIMVKCAFLVFFLHSARCTKDLTVLHTLTLVHAHAITRVENHDAVGFHGP